ncbi:ABC multidrug transporter Mdr1 [Basidiobolus meristosporus CBS 931.73]|uniref:ABC multidrug transporter Mdr1 n=1 Tax=Basidiobolus meristosporus CBS 931.73 TaxID=1314790 RepID=A0A1Y1YU97_9FUNG|nr:ABC multidrug transporter Mdr1 [Basidiobolus meristosporus CBS 931.73]|eukprot:ORY01608.1 ABC multidrug transporter Mdr1 [Basidiobolus meristosporus CBS 931.73]
MTTNKRKDPAKDGDSTLNEKIPLDTKTEEKETKVSMRELFNFATSFDWTLMTIGIFCAMIAGAGMPVMTIIFGELVGVMSNWMYGLMTPDAFKKEIGRYALYFVYLAIAVLVTTYGYMCTWVYAGERQTRKIHIAWFDKLGAGEVTTRITSDTHLVQDGISEKAPQTINYIATFISAFIIAFTRNWKLTLVLCVIIPLIAISVGVLNFFNSKYVKKALDYYSLSGTLAEEVFSSIRTAVAFGQQKKLGDMYDVNIANAKKQGMKKSLLTGLGIGVIFLIIYAAYSLAFWFGGKLINNNELDVGQVMNVFFAVMIGAFSLGHIAPNLQAFSFAQGAASKLYEAIYRIPPIDSSSEAGIKPTQPTQGLIEARNIFFHYPSRPDVPILKGISLSIEPGHTVALVGASGSGKSTIIQLLERFYDPIQGGILLDGTPIEDLNVHWLRRQIGLVSQEPTLFRCTIAENVAHGLIGTPHENASPEKKMELIKEACKMANAHDFITMLPDQYDTHVGERGFLLSGGQKQRIAIARAIVKDPRILLLDEATSALDTQSEGIVQQALDRASSGRTTIVIAHRLSTIRNANQIIVMEKGDIVEQGTHKSLIEAKGAYYKLVELQKIARKDDDEVDGTLPPEDTDLSAVKSIDSQLRRKTTVQSMHSTGNQLSLENGDEEKNHSLIYVIYRVYLLSKPELSFMLLGLAGSVVSGLVTPIFAILFSKIIAVMSPTNPTLIKDINFWASMFLIIACCAFISNTAQGTFFGIAGERLIERIRSKTFNAMLRQEIGWFDRDSNNTGALVSALSTDATHVQGVSGVTLGTILQVFCTIVGGFIIGFVYGWKLTLVVVACVPVLMGAGVIRMKMMNGYQEQQKKAYEYSAQLACEAASAVRTVASLTREQDVCAMYHKELDGPVKEGIKNAFGSSFIFALSQAIVFLVNALGFWYGGTLIANGEYDLQKFMVIFMSIVFGAQSAGNIFSFVPDISKAKSAASHIINLLDRQPLIDVSTNEGDKVPAIEGRVTYNNVHFRYPTRPGVAVLRGLNLDIRPGQYAALVGPSGCGKSTVIGLTERFYDVLSGNVMVDGKDVRQMNINDLRKHIALVGQEPTLYDMTIRENICFGLVDRVPSQEEIEKAARDANIHDFIMGLPKGYDTPLGSKGSQLSGGQKQRIAIARALIRNPKILLLDEATSALDAESEKVGRTTIAKADVIYVFKNGVVNEQGTHEELMALKGQYYALVIQQDLGTN